MKFQFDWEDRINGKSDALADDVNYLAKGIEELQSFLQDLEGGNVAFDELYYDRADGYLHVRKDGVDIVAPQFIGILSEKKMTLTDVSKIYDKATDVEFSELLFNETELAYPNVVNELSAKEDGIKLSITFSQPHSIGDIYAYNVLGDKSITLQFQPFIQGTNENITLYFDGNPVGDQWGNFIIDVSPNHCVAIEYDGERYNILGEYGDDTQISLTDGMHKAIFPQFDKDRTMGDMIWKNASDFKQWKSVHQIIGDGDIQLEQDEEYFVIATGDCSFHLPNIPDLQYFHSIDVELSLKREHAISFVSPGELMYDDGVVPKFSVGAYRLKFVKMPTQGRWALKVIKYEDDWSEALGLRVDFENCLFERLQSAEGKSAGADFDAYPMYGGRKRCNVEDSGTILAYEGDAGYTEDGTNGQVMVYQPAFYYKLIPLVLDGTKLRKAEYYISEKPLAGFKRHPAFYDVNGNEIDYILLSAFEGCIYDTDAGDDGSGAYVLETTDTLPYAPNFANYETDKLSSIAGALPSRGVTVAEAEKLANNRGEGWHIDHMLSLSVNQWLMMIESGALNSRKQYGSGIVIGNLMKTGTKGKYNSNGDTQMLYRGCESLWGNVGMFVGGFRFDNDTNMYVAPQYFYDATDQTFPWMSMQTTYCGRGYISAFAYIADADWAFVFAEAKGTSALPVGSYTYGNPTEEMGIMVAGLSYGYTDRSGIFSYYPRLRDGGSTYEPVGARLLYIPTAQQEDEA